MFAEYLYDLFVITREEKAPDLATVGLAMLQEKKPLPEGVTSQELRFFLGRHREKLVAAFNGGTREEFMDVVAACLAKDRKKTDEDEEEANLCGDGVCEIPEV